MSRQLPTHHADCNNIVATDIPGIGGGNHRYEISGFDFYNNPAATRNDRHLSPTKELVLLFQNGHPAKHGANGVTMEALTEIIIDRLMGFQSGVDRCEESAEAIEHFRKGLECLYERSDKRVEQVNIEVL